MNRSLQFEKKIHVFVSFGGSQAMRRSGVLPAVLLDVIKRVPRAPSDQNWNVESLVSKCVHKIRFNVQQTPIKLGRLAGSAVSARESRLSCLHIYKGVWYRSCNVWISPPLLGTYGLIWKSAKVFDPGCWSQGVRISRRAYGRSPLQTGVRNSKGVPTAKC